jgi:4-hydroxy-3-methylbut-2-enyl diphosphate reductase
MKVIRASTAGFCMGVSLALRRLDKALEVGGSGRLITLGPVIHNPRVMEAYARKGVLCLEDPAAVRRGDRVLLRAHGVPRGVEKALTEAGAVIVDATCPKVKKAQLAIAAEWRNTGGTLLLFGEADHPEVRGLVSYTGGPALVFASEEEFERLPLPAGQACFLAAQTTQDQEAFARVRERFAARLGPRLPVLPTICDATGKRQEEVLRLAGQVDGVVVVGGLNSGNTRRLAEVAAGRGARVAHVESVGELPLAAISAWRSAGLTAGASTPAAHIDAVQKVLEAL